MLAVVLALSSSLVWGASDFMNGVLVRRHNVATITLLLHITGLVILGIVVAIVGMNQDAVLVGLAAGVFGGVAVYAFFKAMSLGTMSIASPLLSLGSLITLALAFARGERPSPVSLIGAIVALIGAVLVSRQDPERGAPQRNAALTWALVAPFALGFHLYLLGLGAGEGGSLSAVFGSRSASSLVLLGLALWLRPTFRIGWSAFALAALMGLSTSAALILFGYAADVGSISITSILASLYPAVTITLAHVLLGERLHGMQLAGVPLILFGAAVVTRG